MRVLLTYLIVSLSLLGVVPAQVLCTGGTHEAHVLDSAIDHEFEHHGVLFAHEDDETYFCGHRLPGEADHCPEDDCVDVELRLDMALAAQEDTVVSPQAAFAHAHPGSPDAVQARIEQRGLSSAVDPPSSVSPLESSCRLTI